MSPNNVEKGTAPDLSAELSIWKTATLSVAGVLFLLLVWAVGIEPALLRVREQTLVLERLPPELEGMRIAVISDLHVGAPHISLAQIKKLARKTNAAHP